MSKTIKEIEEILNSIYFGNFTNKDIILLFVYLRNLDSSKSIVWELGSFFAHLEGRNRGISHGLIYGYINNVIEVSAKGGTIKSKKLSNKESILAKVTQLLGDNIPHFDREKIELNKEKIFRYLFEKLDGMTFKFTNPIIRKCFLKNNSNKLSFCFNLNLTTGRIRMGPNALWCNTLFD